MSLSKTIDNKTIKIILMIILITVPIYIIFIYASLSPGVNSYVHFEDKMYYSKKVENNITTITITSYITNEGLSDSGEVRIKIFVKDQKGISHSEGEKEVGTIPSHKTEEVLIDVVVSESERYSVDALLFEDDEHVVSSKGDFTAPIITEPKQTSGGAFSPDEEREDSTKKDYSTPGFGLLELILIVLVLLFLIKRKERFKK